MSFVQFNTLSYFTFDSFRPLPVRHGIFTRHGGVSPEPWASLNLGGLMGDPRENVIENRKRIFDVFSLPVESIFDTWQVHGTEVVCTEQPRPLEQAHTKADAILTQKKGITLFMRFADCVPLIFCDPVQQVIGLAHAGWKGTVARIGEITIQRMAAQYGSRPEDVWAGIGPSIGVDHYEVGNEVVESLQDTWKAEWLDEVLIRKDGKVYFDLWKANRQVLEQSGVRHIETAGICTACNSEDWFSHRAEKGKTGRFAALITLD